MLTTNDVARVYDTILSTPGMYDKVKVDVRISRKNVLFLSNIIERGLQVKDDEKPYLLKSVPEETFQELRAFSENCLEKAGLVELSEKLNSLEDGK